MKLVVVYRAHHVWAGEIANRLELAGLHPQFDDGPRWSVMYGGFSTTPVYVPEEEAGRAREILGTMEAQAEARIAAVVSQAEYVGQRLFELG